MYNVQCSMYNSPVNDASMVKEKKSTDNLSRVEPRSTELKLS